MLLLISDANVLIDVEVGGLTSAMFSLPYQLAVPDILFEDELKNYHGHLISFGLVSKPMGSELIAEAYSLRQIYSRPSMNDLLALTLAKYENCQLLTGDKALREIAAEHNLEVHGTIWLIEKMIQHQKITIDLSRAAFQMMKNFDRRLPWNEAEKMLLTQEQEIFAIL